MATLNFANREITAKVVYFGARDAGCNTNLRQLHRHLTGRGAGKLHKFGPTDTEQRSYFFEHEADEAEVNGFTLRAQVYSLPGSLTLHAHRMEVLRDVDALVFVADARAPRERHNLNALLELEALLQGQGLELAAVPLVLQVNHSAHAEARPVSDVTFDLNPYGFPVLTANASEGEGVLPVFEEILGAVAARIRDSLAGNEAAISLTAVHHTRRISDEELLAAHLSAIEAQSGADPVELDQALATVEISPLDAPLTESTLPLTPRELDGARPLQLLAGTLVEDGLRVVLLMQKENGDLCRLQILLATHHTPTPARSSPAPATPADEDRIANYLPEAVHLTPPPLDDEGSPLSAILYGLIGLAGGVLIGLLAGYLLGAIF